LTPTPLILAIAGDPGGAAALAPVLAALQADKRTRVLALPYLQARDVWKLHRLECEAIDEELSSAAIFERLQAARPALILTGTSVNALDLERRFIAAAKTLGLPSLAVLDFWSNYSRRFSESSQEALCLPDCVAVMDEQAHREMLAEGFPAARMRITGQPAFDGLATLRLRFTSAQRQKLRAGLGVPERDRLIVFASQPLSTFYTELVDRSLHPGYDEQSVLAGLIRNLEALARDTGTGMTLVIRPHPREMTEAFAQIHSPWIRTVVSFQENARELLLSADLVIGMTTVLLVEACHLACPTLSLQPGLRVPDVLPTNRLGLSRAVYRWEELLPMLSGWLRNEPEWQAAQQSITAWSPEGHATERVVKLVYEMTQSNDSRAHEPDFKEARSGVLPCQERLENDLSVLRGGDNPCPN